MIISQKKIGKFTYSLQNISQQFGQKRKTALLEEIEGKGSAYASQGTTQYI